MEHNPLISVIVPAYNAEKTLAVCLDSIIAQTYPNIEIILIDDGSTDETGEIAREYEKRDPRIRNIHQNNAGLIETRDRGIALAKGDYVGFVDADDEISEDMYERLLRNAQKYEANISQCGVHICSIGGKNGKFKESGAPGSKGTEDPGLKGTGELIVYNRKEGTKALLCGQEMEPSLCNKLYKKELLADSCLDKSILNNEDLLRNAVLFGRADRSVMEDFRGYIYNRHEDSMSGDTSRSADIARDIMAARKKIISIVDEDVQIYAHYSFLVAVVGSLYSLRRVRTADAKSVRDYCRKQLRGYAMERNILRQMPGRLRLKIALALRSPKLMYMAQNGYNAYKKRYRLP